ncbi:MAG TPA: ABC-type transport auxiliary lipoprotein family protein [Steroidobacteraceae bacterium]|nr:ABC-type transport auxiliary lipoprotein family protein [Steroidobacteraceae bacterium]
MRNAIRLTGILLLALLASACGTSELLQSKVAEPQVYVLKPADAGVAQVAFNYQLAVALPTALPGLDTDRIAVLRNGNHLDYYFGARWGGTAPEVTQAFIVALLQSQQGFRNVVAENARIDADYLLEVSIADFQTEYAGSDAPVVHVTVVANLISIKQRKSLPAIRATASVNAKDNRLGAVVDAFQSALQQTTTHLSEQLVTALK